MYVCNSLVMIIMLLQLEIALTKRLPAGNVSHVF